MTRIAFVFLTAALLGLAINASVIHSTFPVAVAPDFILILTVVISLYFHNAWGVLGAFSLGLLADFASARYLGPNAAGCVVAFALVGLIANRVYADKMVAVFIITFLCGIAKGMTFLGLILLYVDNYTVPAGVIRLLTLDALISAACAPLVLRLLRNNVVSVSSGKPQGAPLYRYSS